MRRGGKLQAARYFIDCQLLAQAISDVTGKQTSVFPGLVGDHTNWSRMSVCTGEECQFRHRIRPNRGIAMSASRGYVLFAFHVSQHALGRWAIKASLIGLFHFFSVRQPESALQLRQSRDHHTPLPQITICTVRSRPLSLWLLQA